MSRRIDHALILTGADAALLYQAANLRDLRIAARGRSERLYTLLVELSETAFAHVAAADGNQPSPVVNADKHEDITSVEHIAREAGVTPRTIRNHIEAGLLQARKINRTWVITTADAQQYITGRQAA